MGGKRKMICGKCYAYGQVERFCTRERGHAGPCSGNSEPIVGFDFSKDLMEKLMMDFFLKYDVSKDTLASAMGDFRSAMCVAYYHGVRDALAPKEENIEGLRIVT